MHTRRNLGSWAVGGLAVVALGVACSSDPSNDDEGAGAAGKGGKGGSSAGTSNKAGSTNGGGGGSSGKSNAGSGGSEPPAAGAAGGEALGGEGGAAPLPLGGAGGEPEVGGQAGEGPAAVGGEGGGAIDSSISCETVRTTLLGPIASISTGLVEVTSDTAAAVIELRVDASAGGYMAAANNPYIYLSLANKARVDV